MAMEIKEFICETCGAKFVSECEAEECEKTHTSVSKIINEVHTPRLPHPRYVDILMKDGTKHRCEFVFGYRIRG